MKTTISFKLDAEMKKSIENTIDNVVKLKSVDKGKALYLIIKSFNESSKLQDNVDYSHVKPFECNFLVHYNEEWNCNEPMSTSKKPISFGDDIEIIRSKCRACFEGHSITENERKRKLLERSNILKLTEFYKEFTALTKQGFDADCIMCRGALLEKNTVIMSRDGEILRCPLQNMDIVYIKDTCNEVTNTVNKTKGCQYLITLDHHVEFKGSDIEKKIKAILPQLEKAEDEKEEL